MKKGFKQKSREHWLQTSASEASSRRFGRIDTSSSYVRSPRRLEDTLDGTSQAGLLVTEVTTWPKINITEQNCFLLTIWIILFCYSLLKIDISKLTDTRFLNDVKKDVGKHVGKHVKKLTRFRPSNSRHESETS